MVTVHYSLWVKCTQVRPLNEWKCKKCSITVNTVDNSDDTEIESESHDVENLNVNENVLHVEDINFAKCDRMLFNPLPFENMSKNQKQLTKIF